MSLLRISAGCGCSSCSCSKGNKGFGSVTISAGNDISCPTGWYLIGSRCFPPLNPLPTPPRTIGAGGCPKGYFRSTNNLSICVPQSIATASSGGGFLEYLKSGITISDAGVGDQPMGSKIPGWMIAAGVALVLILLTGGRRSQGSTIVLR